MSDVSFVDAEGFTGSNADKLTFRFIVLEHLRKILRLSSVEFCGGYYKDVWNTVGGATKKTTTYIQDTGESYCNAVDALHDILYPHFDKHTKDKSKKYDEDLDKAKQKCSKELEFNLEMYKRMKVEIKRHMFRELNVFLKTNHYMESQSFDEVV